MIYNIFTSLIAMAFTTLIHKIDVVTIGIDNHLMLENDLIFKWYHSSVATIEGVNMVLLGIHLHACNDKTEQNDLNNQILISIQIRALRVHFVQQSDMNKMSIFIPWPKNLQTSWHVVVCIYTQFCMHGLHL